MDFFGSIRKGFAQVVQIASDNEIFNEFPNCSTLLTTNKLSIKLNLNNEALYSRCIQWAKQLSETFNDIPFLIRNEERRKAIIMTATVEAENGISVKTNTRNSVMIIQPPNNSPNCIGKLMHPAPATLFKVMQEESNPEKYIVYHSYSNQPIMKIEKLHTLMGRFFTIIGTDYAHCFKTMTGTKLGYIRPKIVFTSNVLILKFKRNNRDVQTRATMLGVAILFAIIEAYPEIGKMLIETFRIRRTLNRL